MLSITVRHSHCHGKKAPSLPLSLIGFGRYVFEAKVKEAELLLFLLHDYRERAIPYSLSLRMILLVVLLKSQ